MQLEVHNLETVKERDAYRHLLRRSPHGSPFSDPSFQAYQDCDIRILGVFKGLELVGGGLLPLAGASLSKYLPGVPWNGLIGRDGAEGANQAIARGVVEYCEREFGESTLTLAPEWMDIRPFIWAGWRAHVRYTYRGDGNQPFEKRVKIRPCIVRSTVLYETDYWSLVSCATGDSTITTIWDPRTVYYWKANEGGTWHTELVAAMIAEARRTDHTFDLVGCNGPGGIGLFKRGFGGQLTPYYAVSTSDDYDLRAESYRPEDLREVPAGAGAAHQQVL